MLPNGRLARVHLDGLGDGARLVRQLLERGLELPRIDTFRRLAEEALAEHVELMAQRQDFLLRRGGATPRRRAKPAWDSPLVRHCETNRAIFFVLDRCAMPTLRGRESATFTQTSRRPLSDAYPDPEFRPPDVRLRRRPFDRRFLWCERDEGGTQMGQSRKGWKVIAQNRHPILEIRVRLG